MVRLWAKRTFRAPGTPAIWDATDGLQDLNTVYSGARAWSTAHGGTILTLNAATAINDSGAIVGYGTDSLGHTNQIFLIMPTATPEPSTLLLAVTGLVGLLAGVWQKRK